MLLVSAVVIDVEQMHSCCAATAKAGACRARSAMVVLHALVCVMLGMRRVSMHRKMVGAVLRTSTKKRVEIIDIIHVCPRSVSVPWTVFW